MWSARPAGRSLLQVEGEQRIPGGNGDVLPAVEHEGLRAVGQVAQVVVKTWRPRITAA